MLCHNCPLPVSHSTTWPLNLHRETRAQAIACTGPAPSSPPIGRLSAERHCFETLDGSGDAPGRVSGAAIHLTNSTFPPFSFGNNVGREPPISATCNGIHEIRGDPAASLLAQTAPLPCPSAQLDFFFPWVLASVSDNDFQKVIHPQTTRPVSPGPISLLSSWPDSRLRLDSQKQLARVCLSRATTGHSLQSLFTSGDRARSHWFELFYHHFILPTKLDRYMSSRPPSTVVIPRLFAPAIIPSGHRASPRPFTTADHARRSYLTLIAVRHWSSDGQSG